MKNYRYNDMLSKIQGNALLRPLDVLLVGGTGAGKSSTINAIFESGITRVGDGVDPETKNISNHLLHDYLRLHDSAGLGDGKESDLIHSKNIVELLCKTIVIDGTRYGFIDLVVVVLDGGSRDLGTSYKVLENVVKNIDPDRVIVAINQADMAMKGRRWDSVRNVPEPELKDFLEEKSLSVQKRLRDSTGLSISRPVYYSARSGYNISCFIDKIIEHLPLRRRII